MEILVWMSWLFRLAMLLLVFAAVVAVIYAVVSVWESWSIGRTMSAISCRCGRVVLGPRDRRRVEVELDRVLHCHDRCQPLPEAVT